MTATTEQKKPTRNFPFMEGILPIDRSRISIDIVAGITLAALAIPEVMGYTKIAGMPVVTGLYTILIPTALFALFGSSRHLVVGARLGHGGHHGGRIGRAGSDRLAGVCSLCRDPGAHGCRFSDPGPDYQAGVHRRFPLAHGVDRLPDRRRHPGGDRADIGHAGHPWRRGRPGAKTDHRLPAAWRRPTFIRWLYRSQCW